MKKFINMYTGTVMLVADEREDEYKKLGFKMVEEEKKPKPKSTKKRSEG